MFEFSYSKEVPLKDIQGTVSFTTLPIRINKDDWRIRKSSRRFQVAWAAANTDSMESLRSLETPFGHMISMAVPECSPQILEAVAKLCDFGFFENG
jgi:hypothetical protein